MAVSRPVGTWAAEGKENPRFPSSLTCLFSVVFNVGQN
jgi:hypothetical protein